jgi:hypothetical protein
MSYALQKVKIIRASTIHAWSISRPSE